MDMTAAGLRGPQYMRALERANQVRHARATLKRQIANGELCTADVILNCPWEAHGMTVADLLVSQRRWGQTRTRRFLAGIPMMETKTIGSMTERQRARVTEELAAINDDRQPGKAPDTTRPVGLGGPPPTRLQVIHDICAAVPSKSRGPGRAAGRETIDIVASRDATLAERSLSARGARKKGASVDLQSCQECG